MLNCRTRFTPELMIDIFSKRGEEIDSVEGIQIEPGVGEHQNFLSNVFKVTVQLKSGSGQRKTRRLFVKYGEQGKKKAGFEIKKRYFDSESKAYDFIDKCCKWSRKKKLNFDKYWPDRLYSSVDNNIFIIMLQDLTEMGFDVMRNARGLLDKNHIYVAVERLARCHAMTRVYIAENTPDTSHWPQPSFDFLRNFLRSGLKVLAQAVTKYDEKWDYIGEYLLELSESFNDEYLECIKNVEKDFPVLSMGDCWTNNILFKYSDADETVPVDARFIDFQFSYITSFAWDLQNLIYITQLPRERMENIESLLDTYHGSFVQTVAKLGGQPCLSPSREQIDEIMDKLLLPQFLYSSITAVEIYSSVEEDFENGGLPGICLDWFLKDAEINGYIDNIKYFESKGLFKR